MLAPVYPGPTRETALERALSRRGASCRADIRPVHLRAIPWQARKLRMRHVIPLSGFDSTPGVVFALVVLYLSDEAGLIATPRHLSQVRPRVSARRRWHPRRAPVRLPLRFPARPSSPTS